MDNIEADINLLFVDYEDGLMDIEELRLQVLNVMQDVD